MRYGFLFLAIGLLVCHPSFTWGDEFRIVPSVAVLEQYDSNILFLSENVTGDFITTLSPGIEIVNRTERLDTDLSLRLDRLEYTENPGLDATNQTYDGKFRYAVTPLLNVSAEGDYERNSNPRLNLVTTGGLVTVPAPWDHITVPLSADYQLTEKTSAVVTYSYRWDHFETIENNDDTTQDASAGLVYDFGQYVPAVKGRITLIYGHYSFPDSLVDPLAVTVGFSRDFDEVWSISVDGGVNRTRSKILITEAVPSVVDGQVNYPPGQVTNARSGLVGKVSLDYKGERCNGDLSYIRNVAPAYSLNGAALYNALALSGQYRLTYELSMILSASYYTYKSSPLTYSTQVIDQETLAAHFGGRYEFSRDTAVEAFWDYNRVRYPASNSSASVNIFSVRLYTQYRFLE